MFFHLLRGVGGGGGGTQIGILSGAGVQLRRWMVHMLISVY